MSYKEANSILGTVGEEELTEEIFAMMKDCFVGRFQRESNTIQMCLPSGEKFVLTVKQEA